LDIGSLTGDITIEDNANGVLSSISSRIEDLARDFESSARSITASAHEMGGGANEAGGEWSLFGGVLDDVFGSWPAKIAEGVLLRDMVHELIAVVKEGAIEFSKTGSEVDDVEKAFQRLSGSVENADGILAQMRKGTVGTITDFNLMKEANKLLEAGVIADAKSFGVMTEAARVLSRSGLGTLPDVLAQLDRGMQTGLLRGPLLKSLHIDLTKVEADYATALGHTGEKLSAQGKLLADRGGLLTAFKDKVKEAGFQETSLGEKIDQARTAAANWTNDLAKAIARSPEVNAAYDAIKAALVRAFGSDSQTMLEKIVGWVNRIADAAREYGPIVVDKLAAIKDKVIALVKGVEASWDAMPSWLRAITKDALIAAVAMEGVNIASHELTGTDILGNVASAAQIWGTWGAKITSAATVAYWPLKLLISQIEIFGVSIGISTTAALLWSKTLTLMSGSFGITGLFVALGAAVWQVGEAIAHFGENWKKGGGTLWGFLTLKEDDQSANFLRRLAASMHLVTLSLPPEGAVHGKDTYLGPESEVAGVKKPVVDLFAAGKDKTAESLARTENLWDEYYALVSKMDGDSLQSRYDNITRWYDKEIVTLEKSKKNNKNYQDELFAIGLLRQTKEFDAQKTYATAQIDELNKSASATLAAQTKNYLAGFDLQEEQLRQSTEVEKRGLAERFKTGKISSLTYWAELGDIESKATVESLMLWTANEQAKERVTANGERAILAIRRQYDDLMNASTLTASAAQVAQIKRETGIMLASYTGRIADYGKYVEAIMALDKKRQADVFINNDVLRNTSRATLEEIADRDAATYMRMKIDPDNYSKEAVDAQYRVATASKFAAQETKGNWGKAWNSIKTSLHEVLLSIPQTLASAFTGGGDTFGAVKSIASTVGAGVGGAIGFAMGGKMGAAIGSAIGSLAGPLLGGLKKLFGVGLSAGGILDQKATTDIKTLQTNLLKTYGTLADIDTIGKIVGVDLKAAWGDQSREGLAHFTAMMTDFEAKWKTINDLVSSGKIAWADLGAEANKLHIAQAAASIQSQFDAVLRAGGSADKAAKAVSADLNTLIVDSVKAGVKIPAALRPIIETMIRTHQLTDAAARAMLGLADDTMPSLADIKDAADRYGLSLDALGPKVQQLQITEAANQIVKDFNLLTLAGADFNTIMLGGDDAAKRMGSQIQDVVSKSLTLGLELPDALRPIIEQMITAGMLTDQFGKKLTDTTKLKFAVDLKSMFETLLTKLDELIDKISNGVGGAFDALGNKVVRPTIKPRYDTTDVLDVQTPDTNAPDYAGGGAIYASTGRVIPFPGQPRGTDTVPVWTTPGERVLTVSQNKAYEGGTQQTIEIHIGDEVIRHTAKGMPRYLKLAGRR
jgi:hypothetical protein